jgi:hypothetical protein
LFSLALPLCWFSGVTTAYAQQQTTISVIPNQAWTATGLSVTSGQQVSITAGGELDWQDSGCSWPNSNNCTSGPDGPGPSVCDTSPHGNEPAPNLPCNSLIGKIGENGTPFEVGTSLDITAAAAGELYLGVNDNYLPDNSGGWKATIGDNDTASGIGALYSNTSGQYDTATGFNALFSNTTGNGNSAYGANALASNTTGANNTAFGYESLQANTTGKGNAAQGVNALSSNTTGIRNLGIGNNALYNNNGSYNIGLGFEGGYNVTTGSNNIEIGTSGTASDNNTIRIGVQGTQTFTSIAGIFGTTLTGSAVYVTSTGQLGVVASSERYKTDITSITDQPEKLKQLRPVSFHLKDDPHGPVQYGLIAEEVDNVYPELVIRDMNGQIQGVRYEELAPMLLSDLQHERAETAEKIQSLSEENAQQASEIRELRKIVLEMQAGIIKLQAKDAVDAQR